VVGIADARYGEAVGAFLQQRVYQDKPSPSQLQEFVRETLGWHKAPTHVWWLGPDEDFPKTGSGKIKKIVLKEKGETLLKKAARTAKL
jgi:long-chain acyl-CoA synthetase